MNSVNDEKKRNVALTVGVYDTAIGMFPLLSMTSFCAVTGLTEHLNIVRFLGFSWAGLGLALLAMHNKPKAVNVLGVMSTLAGGSLALAQIILVATKAISPVFLIQTVAELTIGFTWMKVLRRGKGVGSKPSSIVQRDLIAR